MRLNRGEMASILAPNASDAAAVPAGDRALKDYLTG
jgi:hypothetical protein